MGLFGDSKQDQLDAAAKKVFQSINDLTTYIDSNSGKLDQYGPYYAGIAEDSVVEFCRICQQYQSSHNYVMWMGQKTLIMGVLNSIMGIVTEIERETGHVFTKLR